MTTLTMVRRDAVDANYARPAYTMGCEVNPIPFGCIVCPLPTCKYDQPRTGSEQSRERARLNRDRALELLGNGLTVTEVAASLGLSTRVIFRYKSRR